MENILSHLLIDGIRKSLVQAAGSFSSDQGGKRNNNNNNFHDIIIDQKEIIRKALIDLEAEIAPQATGVNLTNLTQ
jgi:hypothetical protein